MYKTTFVSAFVNIEGSIDTGNNHHKTLEKRVEYFEIIAKTGIPIVLYLCPKLKPVILPSIEKYTNVKCFEYDHTRSMLYTMGLNPNLKYPYCRNEKKDTREYMAFMHCKIEYMNHAVFINPWETENFAWFDFSIAYIFRNVELSLERIVGLSLRSCENPNKILIAGCLPKLESDASIVEHIQWRFCGGFFMGSAKAIRDFYSKYLLYYPVFLKKHHHIVWEVNFWAWLEYNEDANWKPIWYYGDHNDSILDVPDEVLA